MSLIQDISSDPILNKSYFSKLEDVGFNIPSTEVKELYKSIRGLKSTKPGRIVPKISSSDDYQVQISLLSQVQSLQDQIHENDINLRIIYANYSELKDEAMNYINKKYYSELSELSSESAKKTVIAAALHPIENGLSKLESLIEMSDLTMKHLDRTGWNLKEANGLVSEYLKVMRYPMKVSV